MSSTAEPAVLLSQETLPGAWRQLRLKAPACASALAPGLMPVLAGRARTLMGCDPVGGTLSLALGPDEALPEVWRIEGLAGTAAPLPQGPVVLVGEDKGLFALVYWLSVLRRRPGVQPLTLLGTRGVFPFQPAPSRIYLPDMPAAVIATMPLLDDWQLPGRLAHEEGLPGCFEGRVLDFARLWLAGLTAETRAQTSLILAGSATWCDTAENALAEFRLLARHSQRLD